MRNPKWRGYGVPKEANNLTASPSSTEGPVLVPLTLPVSFLSSKWSGSWLHGFFRGVDDVLDDLQRIQVLGALLSMTVAHKSDRDGHEEYGVDSTIYYI